MSKIGGWWNASDHTKELHDIAFIGTVVLAWVWLGHGVYKGKGFTDGWNQAFLTLTGAITLVKGNGMWTNRNSLSTTTGNVDAPKEPEGEQK